MSRIYLRSLLFKSALIQQQIEREHSARRPDWLRLLKLKKLRLTIKDRIARLIAKARSPLHLQPAAVDRRRLPQSV